MAQRHLYSLLSSCAVIQGTTLLLVGLKAGQTCGDAYSDRFNAKLNGAHLISDYLADLNRVRVAAYCYVWLRSKLFSIKYSKTLYGIYKVYYYTFMR